LHIVRAVVDVIQECNLRCLYCHPGKVWIKQHLDAEHVSAVFAAAERYGLLELVISGGEATLHPQLPAILAATHQLRQTAAVLITNATKVDHDLVTAVAGSNLTRICVSLDGPDGPTHGSARGRNFPRVLDGLRRLGGAGKPITVISVVHKQNFRRLPELSAMLAEAGLVSQHHLCAPSFSGTAREHYGRLKLDWDDYLTVQQAVDAAHAELIGRGLYVTFNSFWPAIGQRSLHVNNARTITLQQLSEQAKDSLVNVRPNGEFRINATTWGRETIGNAVIGNVRHEDPEALLWAAEQQFRDGSLGQLPREVEAVHKFQLGRQASQQATNAIIDSDANPSSLAELIPIRPLSAHWLLDNPLDRAELADIAARARRSQSSFRFLRHASGVHLLFDKPRSHVTLLTEPEWQQFAASMTRPAGVEDAR